MSEEVNERPPEARNRWLLLVSWLWVSVPLVYGVYELTTKASTLFVR